MKCYQEYGPAQRRESCKVMVGGVAVGGNAPIVVQSMTNTDTADIAARLAYSEPTIKNCIQRLFERLEVRNRPHAVAVALRAGII